MPRRNVGRGRDPARKEVLNLPSTAERGSEAAREALVALGRERFTLDFRDTPTRFDDAVWDVRHLRTRVNATENVRLYFTRYLPSAAAAATRIRQHPGAREPLPPIYADLVKSFIVLERASISNASQRVGACRLLWEAVLERINGDVTRFRWSDLGARDLARAETLMLDRWAASSTHKTGQQLLRFARFLAARRIVPEPYYTLATPRQQDLHRYTIDSQEGRLSRLPSTRALEHLADAFRGLATEQADRLRICAVALLVATGFRVGELLTLPVDCEVEEDHAGTARYGLRYHKEKSRGGVKSLAVRWLSESQARLARRAIAEIRTLTQPAREQAHRLESTPECVRLPGRRWNERLDGDTLARLLGLQSRESVSAIPVEKLPRTLNSHSRRFLYRVADVDRYLRAQRVDRLWVIDRRDGTYQMLSETLLIAPRNLFHPGRGTIPLLVEPLTQGQLSDFLGGRAKNTRSLFDRLGLREADGTACRLTTHQFRHWLTDLADKGGMPRAQLTRWLGREHEADTLAYLHMTPDERLAWTRGAIARGEVAGAVADVYRGIAVTDAADADRFLDGHVQAVHVTPYGLCVHDFALTPCAFHLNCLRGCPDYLVDPSDEVQRATLVQLKRRTGEALAAARQADTVADAWVRAHEETLCGIDHALGAHDRVAAERVI